MVNLAEIQAAYYMVAATGVIVAAIYYVLNIRTNQTNQELMLKAQQQTLETRRLTLIESLSARIMNTEGMRNYFEIMSYNWNNYGDFENKYGSDFNVEAAAKRYSVWSNYNSIGGMLRKGLIEVKDVYDMGMLGVIFLWTKYKPVIEEGRRRYNGVNYMKDFEFLAEELLSYVKTSDPNYVMPETLTQYVPDK